MGLDEQRPVERKHRKAGPAVDIKCTTCSARPKPASRKFVLLRDGSRVHLHPYYCKPCRKSGRKANKATGKKRSKPGQSAGAYVLAETLPKGVTCGNRVQFRRSYTLDQCELAPVGDQAGGQEGEEDEDEEEDEEDEEEEEEGGGGGGGGGGAGGGSGGAGSFASSSPSSTDESDDDMVDLR